VKQEQVGVAMSTGLSCPQCHADVEPTWDWCHACGFDPEGLKPQHISVGSVASVADRAAEQAAEGPAPLPAPPRGAATVGLSDGSHPYSGLPYDDTPPDPDEGAPQRRLARRDKSAAKAAAGVAGDTLLKPAPPPPAKPTPSYLIPSEPAAPSAPGTMPYDLAPIAPAESGSAVVPASIIARDAAVVVESSDARRADVASSAGQVSYAAPKKKRSTSSLVIMTVAGIVIIGLMVFSVSTLSETADNAAKPRAATTVDPSGPPPIGAASTTNSSSAGVAGITWVPYQSVDGRFSIEFPAAPSDQTASLTSSAGNTVAVHRYLGFSDTGVFGVDTFDLPATPEFADPNQALVAADAMLRQPSETVVSQEPSVVAGQPALRTVVRTANNGTRITTVVVSGNKGLAAYLSHQPAQGDVSFELPEYQHFLSTLKLGA
jgi:hypothetical protein